jgi:DNA-binding MarR family transcriptional regulator
MHAGDPLGHVEFTVLNAVHRGALRSRPTAQQIAGPRQAPAGQVILHEVLRRCERSGLVRSRRDTSGRRYELTAAGRARLRADRQFRAALIRVLLRGHRPPDGRGVGA